MFNTWFLQTQIQCYLTQHLWHIWASGTLHMACLCEWDFTNGFQEKFDDSPIVLYKYSKWKNFSISPKHGEVRQLWETISPKSLYSISPRFTHVLKIQHNSYNIYWKTYWSAFSALRTIVVHRFQEKDSVMRRRLVSFRCRWMVSEISTRAWRRRRPIEK